MNNMILDNQMTIEEILKDFNMEEPEIVDVEKENIIMKLIPKGVANAISRNELCIASGISDRLVRRLIEQARRHTIIISNNDGSGYWIYPDNPTDNEKNLLNKYVKQQESRAKSIFYVLYPARMAIKKGVF